MTVGEMQIVLGLDDAQLRSGISGSAGLLRSFAAEVQAVSKATGLSQSEVNRLTIGLEDLGNKSEGGGRKLGAMGQASNSANQAIIALGRGVSDAGYGWQFALNNLDPLITSMGQLRTQAAAAGTTLGRTLLSALMSPAGLIAALGVATFAITKFGDDAQTATEKAVSALDRYKERLEDTVSLARQLASLQGEFGAEFTSDQLRDAQRRLPALMREAAFERASTLQRFGLDFSATDEDLRNAGASDQEVQRVRELNTLLNSQVDIAEALRTQLSEVVKQEQLAAVFKQLGLDVSKENSDADKERDKAVSALLEKMRALYAVNRNADASFESLLKNTQKLDTLPSGVTTRTLGSGREIINVPPEMLKGFENFTERMREAEDQAGSTFTAMSEGAINAGLVMEGTAMLGIDALSYGLGDVAMELVMLEASWESVGNTMSRVLGSVVADLTTAVLKAAALKAIGVAFNFGPGASMGFGGILAGILGFGGGRASGGYVSAGTAYLVGERGPEIFQPGQSGAIIPNYALGGAQVVEVRVVGSVTPGGDLAFSGQETGRRRASGVFG